MWDGTIHGWGGRGIGMGLMMLLFWLLVVGVIVLLVWFFARSTRAPNQGQDAPGKDDALEVLRKRYARGEITREQYRVKWSLRNRTALALL